MLVLSAGGGCRRRGREGLAALTADMLDEGTAHLSRSTSTRRSRASVSIWTSTCRPTRRYDNDRVGKFGRQALSLMADCVLRPTLAEADFDRVRDLRLTRLVQIRDIPRRSPIGRSCRSSTAPIRAHMALGTESLRRLTIETVKTFHADATCPSKATLVAAGDIGAAEVRADGDGCFASWGGRAIGCAGGRSHAAPPSRLTPS